MARQRTVTKNRYIFFIISQGRKIRILYVHTGDPNTKDESEGLGAARSAGWGASNLPHLPMANTFWLMTPLVACSTWAPSALLISGQTPPCGQTRNFSQLALLVRPTGYGMVKMMMTIKISICQTSFRQHERVSVCFDMYACLVYAGWLFCSCCFFVFFSPFISTNTIKETETLELK